MKKSLLTTFLLLLCTIYVSAKDEVIISLQDNSGQLIPAEIYGQFSEHLGRCIYDGIWVGEDSPIPNTNGYRTDVLQALIRLHVPVLRWPGGCFADEYHWMEGIGPKDQRARITNNNWGSSLEDNSFGTHEFLTLCEMIGAEPYISGNVGSGTPEELSKWVEYMTSDSKSTIAELRRKNGRENPWNVKFVGIGNESWGCGGNMTPEYYSDLFRRYATYTRNYNGRLYKVASGGNADDFNWTEVLMKKIGTQMDGVSIHYYTVPEDWNHHGSATQFSDKDYYTTLSRALNLESLMTQHIAIMDKYDPERKVDLLLDEWGTWYDVEPGTNPGHLFQQNTIRDALVAALSFHILHRYTNRVKMANIAQIVNVLQAMILTDGDKMLLTPTYHVFEMYSVHQNAEWRPLTIASQTWTETSDGRVPNIDATASVKDGITYVSIANTNLKEAQRVRLQGVPAKSISARILSSQDVHDVNSFDKPNKLQVKDWHNFKQTKSDIILEVPALSIVVLEIK